MSRMRMWLYLAAGGLGALVLAAGSLFAFTLAADAAPATRPGADLTGRSIPVTAPAFGITAHAGGVRLDDEALAEALGISVEELQAAHLEANTAAIEQAVDEGLITQEQAERLLSDGHLRRGRFGLRGLSVDYNVYLAEALGISVEALETAKLEAQRALISRAVEDGRLTEEQADLALAKIAVRPYVWEAMTAAYEEALQQAVADGAITEAQAELLRSNLETGPGFGPEWGGFGRSHGRGRHGGPGFPGGPDFASPVEPAEPTDNSSS